MILLYSVSVCILSIPKTSLQYAISSSVNNDAYSALQTESSMDKSNRPHKKSVENPSDVLPVFRAFEMSRFAVSTPP